MESPIEKSLSFLIFIVIGLLLQSKFKNSAEVKGLKEIILTLALPATIFIALLKIKIDVAWLTLPFLALALNIVLFAATPVVVRLLGIEKSSPKAKTIQLLFPSLAPGLSCFPFILEFLGDGYLAKAAMADLGNKFFVLFVLYLIAIRWHYQNMPASQGSSKTKILNLLKTMITEPVNIFILVALILVGFGINFNNLPFLAKYTLSRLSVLMTPLVLLFIGLSVKFQRRLVFQTISLLFLRAALTLYLVIVLIAVSGITVPAEILFIITFALSACSFWPFAHIATINSKEDTLPKDRKTFDLDFAIAMLAFSLPISVGLILSVFSAQTFILADNNLFLLATTLLVLAFLPHLFVKRKAISFWVSKTPSNPGNSLEEL